MPPTSFPMPSHFFLVVGHEAMTIVDKITTLLKVKEALDATDLAVVAEAFGFTFYYPDHCPELPDLETYAPFRRITLFISALTAAVVGGVGVCRPLAVFKGSASDIPTMEELEALSFQKDVMSMLARTDAHYYDYDEEDPTTSLISVYQTANHDALGSLVYRNEEVHRRYVYSTRLEDATAGDFSKTTGIDPPYVNVLAGPSIKRAVQFAAQRMMEELPPGTNVSHITWGVQPRLIFPSAFNSWHGDSFVRQGIIYLPENDRVTASLPPVTLFARRSFPAPPSSKSVSGVRFPEPRNPEISTPLSSKTPRRRGVIDLRHTQIPYKSLVTFSDEQFDHSRPIAARPQQMFYNATDSTFSQGAGAFIFLGIWADPIDDNGRPT